MLDLPTGRGGRLLPKCHEKPLIPVSLYLPLPCGLAAQRPVGRSLTALLPFWFPTVAGETGVRIEVQLDLGGGQEPLRLRTCAQKPVRLVRGDWPEGLAESVDRRYEARNGFDKGRVLFVWTAGGKAGVERPIACCCWHVHQGNWPLCVFDAGWAGSLDDAVGVALVERVLFGALRQLAADEHLCDRAVSRPADRLGWRVDHQDGAGDLQARRDWARVVATRAQRDFRFARLEKAERPRWAREGFYAERVF
jgi:hypothetical protein